MSETVIKITNLVKEYKMFARKKDRLMEAIFPNLVHKHGTFKAMDNFNLEVKKGEVLGILGKNGAGKSTLLKMITGVVVPTSGSIEVNGKEEEFKNTAMKLQKKSKEYNTFSKVSSLKKRNASTQVIHFDRRLAAKARRKYQ